MLAAVRKLVVGHIWTDRPDYNIGKVKLSLCLTNYALRHEGVLGSVCIYPHCLDLGTSWRWVVRFTPLPLSTRGKSPRYPLDRRQGGPQSRSGRRGEEKITIAAGHRQIIHSPFQVPRNSWLRFNVSGSTLPRSWGPCPRIYIPQALSSLFFASYVGLRWRYSSPPPHGIIPTTLSRILLYIYIHTHTYTRSAAWFY
jgi:hypothetical protein